VLECDFFYFLMFFSNHSIAKKRAFSYLYPAISQMRALAGYCRCFRETLYMNLLLRDFDRAFL
jgi:hypothetical protein